VQIRSLFQAKQPETRVALVESICWHVQPVVQEQLIPVEAERCTCTHVFYRKGTINHLDG
jgi:hypothetical protein